MYKSVLTLRPYYPDYIPPSQMGKFGVLMFKKRPVDLKAELCFRVEHSVPKAEGSPVFIDVLRMKSVQLPTYAGFFS